MHYDDLTNYVYSSLPEIMMRCIRLRPRTLFLNVGWLGRGHPFTIGEVSELFLDKLFYLCKKGGSLTRGHHICEFCLSSTSPTGFLSDEDDSWERRCTVEYKGETIGVDNGEIYLIGREAVYLAPVMIFHYVVDHGYRPPDDFIQFVEIVDIFALRLRI